VECEKKLYLAVAHVNQLHFAGNGDLMTLSTHLLVDATAKVSFQILRIVPATVEDDPSKEYDWCWARNMEATCHDVPGELIQPINPEFLYKDGKAMYLLDSNFLLTVTADLLDRLTHQSRRGVPTVSRTDHFPYRLLGKACFIGEREVQDGVEVLEEKSVCSKCGSKTHVDSSKTQRILEHMGAHILYDSANLRNQEVCGLCLRPAPMCQIYMKKTRGVDRNFSVDTKRSSCVNLVKRFSCSVASESTESSPCTNFPINCSLCPPKSTAVWTYSLDAHFRERHKLSPANFPIQFAISSLERQRMKSIWDKRYEEKKKRSLKKRTRKPLEISAAHSSRRALR
jgi:hypothetical protein